MKSGLEGRNNSLESSLNMAGNMVSMKSGLEGRNNGGNPPPPRQDTRLNEVRPRRPEQLSGSLPIYTSGPYVSMKSGLEGRNNRAAARGGSMGRSSLNEVRPRRPEQWRGRAGIPRKPR